MNILDDEQDKLLNHEYDGIRELDNHMPVWWLWLFYFTIGWGVLYLLYYEVFNFGSDQHEQYALEMAAAEEQYGLGSDNDPQASTGTVAWVFETDEASIANGKEIFMSTNNLCFTCHGNAGEGLVGPNLTDEFWISGCSAEEIATNIANGFMEKGMMPYGSNAPIADEDMTDLISYIASIQGTNPPNPKAVDETRAVQCNME
ncbi:MAG: hypothetical protein ED557_06665 [Balneola sp.]|nr:MAG: hypothetical protein ED557_06665 [Balneola sp.]